MEIIMKKLIVSLALLLTAASAAAGEDSTHRYWSYGPAWYDTPCGLACFQAWERLGLEAADASVAQVRRFQAPADVQRLAANRRHGEGALASATR
jgi:hypothetical protein